MTEKELFDLLPRELSVHCSREELAKLFERFQREPHPRLTLGSFFFSDDYVSDKRGKIVISHYSKYRLTFVKGQRNVGSRKTERYLKLSKYRQPMDHWTFDCVLSDIVNFVYDDYPIRFEMLKVSRELGIL